VLACEEGHLALDEWCRHNVNRFRLVGPLCTAAALLLPLRAAGQTGELRVFVSTSGSSLDANGYVIALDTLRRSIGVNGSALFGSVMPGINTVALLDVAEDCVVPEGNPRRVVVQIGKAAELRFEVACGVPRSPARSDVAEPPPETTVAQEPEPEEAREQEIAPEGEAQAPSERELALEPERQLAPDMDPGSRGATMSDFSAGEWVATVEPPQFPAYPVTVTFTSDQVVGGIVGTASYDAPTWSCSYELMLEEVGEDTLVVTQRLVSGHCPEANVVVFTRARDSLRGKWLRSDTRTWFEAIFARFR
jgi:hypothetical protein